MKFFLEIMNWTTFLFEMLFCTIVGKNHGVAAWLTNQWTITCKGSRFFMRNNFKSLFLLLIYITNRVTGIFSLKKKVIYYTVL